MTPAAPRRAVVLGGNRIPFARSDSAYAKATNQDMLTAALDGLVDRFDLAGERLGEVVAGAVLKHSRDFNLTRECVLGSRLAPETPAYDIQQACGTGLEATILVANKIALGQIEAGVAGGVDTTSDAPLALNEDLRAILLDANRLKSNADRAEAAAARAPAAPRAGDPAQRGAAHRPLDGRAPGAHRRRVGHHARGAGRAGDALAPQPRGRLRARLPGRPRHAVPRAGARPEPAPGLEPGEARQAQARLRRPGGHDDRRQLDAAVGRRRGRAAGQRGVGEGAQPHAARDVRRRRDGRGRLRQRPRGPADGARLRGPADAGAQRPRRCRTSTCTRSTRRSPRRCSPRSPRGRTRSSAPSGSA